MRKNLYILLAIITGLSFLNSCDLDPMPTDRYSERVIWESPEKANLYLNGFYTYLRTYGQFGAAQTGLSGVFTDGLTYALKYAHTGGGYATTNDYAYHPDKITAEQNTMDVWAAGYDRIRRMNEFIDGLHKYADFDQTTKNDFEAQIRFFRAYVYFQIMKRHNQFVIIDKLTSEKDNPLGTTEACWNFIESDLEYAIENLPATRPSEHIGRLTKGSALAFLSRVAVYAGHWDKAKKAAQDCINLKDENGVLVFELNESYENSYKKTYLQSNKESIIDFTYVVPNIIHNMDELYAPGGDAGNSLKVTLAGPTQEMVEMYELKTGGFPNWGPWHGTTLDTPPYADLEPRFHASVLYNGAMWKGRRIEPFVDGKDGFHVYGTNPLSNGRTVTGYFLKKVLDERMTTIGGQSTTPSIEIRLAEVYLNLAEAANKLSDDATANSALRTVRARVGLPWEDKNSTELAAAIRHERTVELAFEGHLYWDLRRWGVASQELNNVRFHGLKISKGGAQYTYEYVLADDNVRFFPEHMNKTFPIPLSELNNNKAVSQLPGW